MTKKELDEILIKEMPILLRDAYTRLKESHIIDVVWRNNDDGSTAIKGSKGEHIVYTYDNEKKVYIVRGSINFKPESKFQDIIKL